MNVQLGPKYASTNKSTQCLKFFCECLMQILTFFLCIPQPLSLQGFCTQLLIMSWVFHIEKKKETYLLYDSHVKVIQEIISFLDHQDIQNSNWSNSAYHPFSCHMLIASAIFLILGMQVIIVMYKIIGYRSCNTERCKIYKYIYIQGKTEKKLVILFHNSQSWLN